MDDNNVVDKKHNGVVGVTVEVVVVAEITFGNDGGVVVVTVERC